MDKQKRGFCSQDCGDSEHTCTAWDGRGYNEVNHHPNHNLIAECPKDIITCPYRKEKIKSSPF